MKISQTDGNINRAWQAVGETVFFACCSAAETRSTQTEQQVTTGSAAVRGRDVVSTNATFGIVCENHVSSFPRDNQFVRQCSVSFVSFVVQRKMKIQQNPQKVWPCRAHTLGRKLVSISRQCWCRMDFTTTFQIGESARCKARERAARWDEVWGSLKLRITVIMKQLCWVSSDNEKRVFIVFRCMSFSQKHPVVVFVVKGCASSSWCDVCSDRPTQVVCILSWKRRRIGRWVSLVHWLKSAGHRIQSTLVHSICFGLLPNLPLEKENQWLQCHRRGVQSVGARISCEDSVAAAFGNKTHVVLLPTGVVHA